MQIKSEYLLLCCLALTSPLGFLPFAANDLFFVWTMMIQGILALPEPSYMGVWGVSLILDFSYNLPIGTTFLSFAMLCVSAEGVRKRLTNAPFLLLWGGALGITLGLDALFFRGDAWKIFLFQRSKCAWFLMMSAYPLSFWICRKVSKNAPISVFQYSLFE
jgi:hypothetical protein